MSRLGRIIGVGLVIVAFAVALRLLGSRSPDGEGPKPPTPTPVGVSSDETPDAAPISILGAWSCPSKWSYAAYASVGHHYFAPNHPRHPDDSLEPDRCYANEGEAQRAGYSPGLVEPNTLLVEGLYLVPVDMGRTCARAASRLGFAVPCPTRLPNPRADGGVPGCVRTFPPSSGCVARGTVPAFLFVYSAFSVPASYQERTNLVITAFRAHPPGTDEFFDYSFLCTEGRSRGPSGSLAEPGPLRGRFVRCPNLYPPPLAGQLILRWSEDGIVYQVSLSDDSPTNRSVLESLVRTSLVLVPPASTATGT